jgi:hypothetical protein
MAITVTLEPEVEEWLRAEADREGTTPEALIARATAAQWAVARRAPRLSANETELLSRINDGFPASFWERFRPLRARMEAKALNEDERQEFIRLNARIEAKNTERIRLLGELARLRGVSLPQIMAQLDIGPIQVPES